ncbi:hypothetical protein CcaCcLH18_12837 [Colletotrichum camelliae]|nr:hypothetical protein CcaCcLH18_12837 [Colletotrichum camelliae]
MLPSLPFLNLESPGTQDVAHVGVDDGYPGWREMYGDISERSLYAEFIEMLQAAAVLVHMSSDDREPCRLDTSLSAPAQQSAGSGAVFLPEKPASQHGIGHGQARAVFPPLQKTMQTGNGHTGGQGRSVVKGGLAGPKLNVTGDCCCRCHDLLVKGLDEIKGLLAQWHIAPPRTTCQYREKSLDVISDDGL